MPKLSVHLVTWNGAKYVPYLFDSLKKQTERNWELFIWDNASGDNMVELMKKEIQDFSVPVELIAHTSNDGFAGGHNALYKKTTGEYVVMLNQDMYLEADCFEKLLAYMEGHADVAAISPRLMRWDFSLVEQQRLEDSFTEYVDSLGLQVFRNRRVIEQYTQERWSPESINPKMVALQSQENLAVFGVSGALPLFRRRAIHDVSFRDGTFLDASYHSYKEDVDLAYRLQSAGMHAVVLLSAVGYHDRSAAGPKELHDAAALENKKKQSSWVKYHSYKNHLMTLYKNEYGKNVLLDFFPIVWYELKKLVYILLFDRAVLKGVGEIWKLRKSLKEKRLFIIHKRKVSREEIRKWWK